MIIKLPCNIHSITINGRCPLILAPVQMKNTLQRCCSISEMTSLWRELSQSSYWWQTELPSLLLSPLRRGISAAVPQIHTAWQRKGIGARTLTWVTAQEITLVPHKCDFGCFLNRRHTYITKPLHSMRARKLEEKMNEGWCRVRAFLKNWTPAYSISSLTAVFAGRVYEQDAG